MSNQPSLQPRILQEASCDGDLLSVVRTPEPNQLFVGGAHGQIALVDLSAEVKFVKSWAAHVSHVSSLVLAGDQLISAGSDHRVLWWDRHSHRPLRIVDDHPKWVRQLALTRDQQLLASVCDDMACRLWEASSGKLIRELRGHETRTPRLLTSKLYCCAFSPDGQQLATADQIGQVVVWEVASGNQLASFRAPLFFTHDTNGHGYGGIRGLAFSPDGKHLALCGNQAGDTSTISGSKSLLHVYDWANKQPTHEWNVGGNFFYERVLFHPQGSWVVGVGGAGFEQKIVFFDLASKEALHQEPSPMLSFDAALSESADSLFTVGRKEMSPQKGHIAHWTWKPAEAEPNAAAPTT